MSDKKYWPNLSGGGSLILEARANIALHLIECNTATIAATNDGEDTAGRSRLRLQAPAELVSRAFAIADAFVDVAEERDAIRGVMSDADVIADTEARLMAMRRLRKEAAAKTEHAADLAAARGDDEKGGAE